MNIGNDERNKKHVEEHGELESVEVGVVTTTESTSVTATNNVISGMDEAAAKTTASTTKEEDGLDKQLGHFEGRLLEKGVHFQLHPDESIAKVSNNAAVAVSGKPMTKEETTSKASMLLQEKASGTKLPTMADIGTPGHSIPKMASSSPPSIVPSSPATLVHPPPSLERNRDITRGPGAFSVAGMEVGIVSAGGRPSEQHQIQAQQDLELFTAIEMLPVEAVAVEEDLEREQMEAEIRQRIFQEAVQADVLPRTNQNETTNVDETADTNKAMQLGETQTKRRKVILGVIAVILLFVLGLGLGLGLSKDDANAKKANGKSSEVLMNDSRSTLDVVRERGYVKCGLNDLGFARIRNPNVSDQLEGFNVQQCKAMALLALGDPNKYEQVWVTPFTRFLFLANKTIDIATEGTTHTMGRDVYEANSKTGFAFTAPYFYSGLVFAGIPAFVDCADALESFYGVCRDLRICVAEGTTHIGIMAEKLRGGVIVPYNGTAAVIDSLRSGKCNVVASEPLYLVKVRELYGEGEWKMGSKQFSKEPLTLVTRHDDSEWSTLANLAVNAFFLAEAHNISQDNNAYDIANLGLDETESGNIDEYNPDKNLSTLLLSLITEFGHYGDLYRRHIESQIPRQIGLNTIYDRTQSTGLLYSIPFGNVNDNGPDPAVNGTLETILERGHLVCGVQPFRGFPFARSSPVKEILFNGAEENNPSPSGLVWSGFDVEFCRGLAAALFAGEQNKVFFVEIQSSTESYFALANGTVDVVAGARVTLQADYHEPSTDRGYTFSSPYYYDNQNKDAFAFMTREEDTQWSDFVYWIVMALIYAEEEGITANVSAEMPVVTLFGEKLKQHARDCISVVGSYGELYNNTLQEFIPQRGANRLNEGLSGPQLFPIPFY